jgi:hypothetical protein
MLASTCIRIDTKPTTPHMIHSVSPLPRVLIVYLAISGNNIPPVLAPHPAIPSAVIFMPELRKCIVVIVTAGQNISP